MVKEAFMAGNKKMLKILASHADIFSIFANELQYLENSRNAR